MKRAMLTGKDGLPSFLLKLGDAYQPLFDSAPGRALRASTRRVRAPGRAASRPDDRPESAGASRAPAALRNTGVRGAAEVVGKLATFLLFAVLAREVGQSGVGAFVFAFAFLGLCMVPIALGCDSYMLREVAKDRTAADRLFFNVIALKLVMAVPVLALCFAGVVALGYDGRTRDDRLRSGSRAAARPSWQIAQRDLQRHRAQRPAGPEPRDPARGHVRAGHRRARPRLRGGRGGGAVLGGVRARLPRRGGPR